MRWIRAAFISLALVAASQAGAFAELPELFPEGTPTATPDEGEAEPGTLSPMSLGQPQPKPKQPSQPRPVVSPEPVHWVTTPDGRKHPAGGVDLRGAKPLMLHDPMAEDHTGPHFGHVDLRRYFPPVRDQGAMGSCVGFGFSALTDFMTGAPKVVFSPLALWSALRKEEGSFPGNEGVGMQDACDFLNDRGSLPEPELPYPEGIQPRSPHFKEALNTAATSEQYQLAGERPGIRIVALRATDQIVSSLDKGLPVVIAFYETRRFSYPLGGGLVDTDGTSFSKEDGHCVIVVGYDDFSKRLIVRNSWGRSWGDRGYCYMSYDYMKQGYIFQAFTLAEPLQGP